LWTDTNTARRSIQRNGSPGGDKKYKIRELVPKTENFGLSSDAAFPAGNFKIFANFSPFPVAFFTEACYFFVTDRSLTYGRKAEMFLREARRL
jgi:hypothetical protein